MPGGLRTCSPQGGQGSHLRAEAVLAGAMQRAQEAGDALWVLGGSPSGRHPAVVGGRLGAQAVQSYRGRFLSAREQEVGDTG